MFRNYYVTGATGFLGRTVIAELEKKGARVRALVLKGDPLAGELPGNVTVVQGISVMTAPWQGFLREQTRKPVSFTAQAWFRWRRTRETAFIG